MIVDEKIYVGKHPIGSTIDYLMDCTKELEKTDPYDTIVSVSGTLESGTLTVGAGTFVDGIAKLRISGTGKLYSRHHVKMVITCTSGQIYSPLLEIQIVR
jgi:hypothetical protein